MAVLLLQLAALILCVGVLGWFLFQYLRTARVNSQWLYRIDHGLCRGCGFSLRGSVDRCGECGRAFRPHEKVPIRHDA